LLKLKLIFFISRGQSKKKLIWGCFWIAAVVIMLLSLYSASGRDVVVGCFAIGGVAAAAAAGVVADVAVVVCVSAKRGGRGEGGPHHPLMMSLVAMPQRGGAL